jgi:hypothetical protein
MGVRSSRLSLKDRDSRISLQTEGDAGNVLGIVQHRDQIVAKLPGRQRRTEPGQISLALQAHRPRVGAGGLVADTGPADDLHGQDCLEVNTQCFLLGDPVRVLRHEPEHVLGAGVATRERRLAFYGRMFEFKLRGKSDTMAFIDLGDQFIALQKGRTQSADDGRHFSLVVDDDPSSPCCCPCIERVPRQHGVMLGANCEASFVARITSRAWQNSAPKPRIA